MSVPIPRRLRPRGRMKRKLDRAFELALGYLPEGREMAGRVSVIGVRKLIENTTAYTYWVGVKVNLKENRPLAVWERVRAEDVEMVVLWPLYLLEDMVEVETERELATTLCHELYHAVLIRRDEKMVLERMRAGERPEEIHRKLAEQHEREVVRKMMEIATRNPLFMATGTIADMKEMALIYRLLPRGRVYSRIQISNLLNTWVVMNRRFLRSYPPSDVERETVEMEEKEVRRIWEGLTESEREEYRRHIEGWFRQARRWRPRWVYLPAP